MKLINLFILVVLISSCSVQQEDYVLSGKVVQIHFSESIQDGDWFKIDGLEFNHVVNDTTDLMNQPSQSHYTYFETNNPEFIDKGYLPSSKLYFHVEDIRDTEDVTAGRMAGIFVQRLFQKQSNLQDGDLIYQVGKAEYLILTGKVFLKRSDDKPIKVYSNSEGRIHFKAISEGDDIYKKLFRK